MTPNNLTEEQHRAATDPSHRLVVRASAGAGKTRVLVARYLRHVQEEGLKPDQILTITFTRKAAAEMKQRIVAALLAEGLRESAQMAETGPIQTIHGFCERLLREVSVDAGLDPEFVVADDGTTDQIRGAAMRYVLASPDLSHDEIGLMETLAGRANYGSSSPHGLLERSLKEGLDGLRGAGHTPDSVEHHAANPDALLRALEHHWFESLDEQVRELASSRPPTEPLALRVFHALKQLKRSVKGLPKPAEVEDFLEAQDQMVREASSLLRLVVRVWRRVESDLAERSTLDFTGLEARALQLLQESETVGRRVREAYRVVMVDESQDLSPLQHRLITALGLPMELRVGDAQQSIYGFRQADVRLFEQASADLPTRLLTQNFRSTLGIQAFVDAVFRSLWGDKYVPLQSGTVDARFDGVELWPQDRNEISEVAKRIAEMVAEGEDPGEVAVLVRRGKYAGHLRAYLAAHGVPSRIAGATERFFARLEVRDLANTLLALQDPSDNLAFLGMLRSPMVGLSLDAIVRLAAGECSLAEIEQDHASEDAIAVERFRSWFEPLSRAAARRSASEVLGEVFAVTPYLENLARRTEAGQRLANVRKLLRLAADRPQMSPREFADFIRELRELDHREGDAPAAGQPLRAVTIMTIHKSKGLEFPVVVVPELLDGLARNAQAVELDKDLGLLAVKFRDPASPLHTWVAERRKQKEREEAVRLLYVALTRAQRRLCVTISTQGDKNLAQLLAKSIGFNGEPVRGARLRG